MATIQIVVILATALHCDGVSIWEQLEHIASRRAESRGELRRNAAARRFGFLGSDTSVIMGAPSYPYHLPEAEAILPGHTLIRPTMNMLKSAVKFPHRELENGAGVYGHIDNLGIRYDGKNERVLYTGFRRMLPETLQNYILVIPRPMKTNLRQKPVYTGLPKVNLKEKLQKDKLQKLFVPDFTQLKKRPGKDRTNSSKRKLTIYPAEIKKLDQLPNGTPGATHKKHRQKRAPSQNIAKALQTKLLLNRIKQRTAPYVKAPNAKKAPDLKRFLRMLMSLRRDENIHQHEVDEQNIVRNNPGTIVVTKSTEDYEKTKTRLFWETKNAFNHIKISPDAPEHAELLPADAAEDTRDWWFYHQSDFEEFENK